MVIHIFTPRIINIEPQRSPLSLDHLPPPQNPIPQPGPPFPPVIPHMFRILYQYNPTIHDYNPLSLSPSLSLSLSPLTKQIRYTIDNINIITNTNNNMLIIMFTIMIIKTIHHLITFQC